MGGNGSNERKEGRREEVKNVRKERMSRKEMVEEGEKSGRKK